MAVHTAQGFAQRFFSGTCARMACRLVLASVVLAEILAGPRTSFAQEASTVAPNAVRSSAKRAGPAASAPAVQLPSHPEWHELSQAQKEALAPLANSWPGIDEQRKRKWLAISRNFSTLPAQEQNRMHERMKDWAALSAQERIQARLNFAGARELTAEKRAEKWEAYQSLPAEQRQHLAATAQGKPTGAAMALKPVAPRKLTTPPGTMAAASKPATTPDSLRGPKIEVQPTQVHPKTLLPIVAPIKLP